MGEVLSDVRKPDNRPALARAGRSRACLARCRCARAAGEQLEAFVSRVRVHKGRDRKPRVDKGRGGGDPRPRQGEQLRRRGERRDGQVRRQPALALPRRRVPQHERRRSQRRAAGRFRGLLPRRRRLRRHPLGDRDRAGLAVPDRHPRHPFHGRVERDAGDDQGRRPGARRQALPSPSTGIEPTSGTTSRPTCAASRTCSRRWTRRPTAAGRWGSTTRSPGARTTRAAARSTRPAATRPRRSPRAASGPTLRARSAGPRVSRIPSTATAAPPSSRTTR